MSVGKLRLVRPPDHNKISGTQGGSSPGASIGLPHGRGIEGLLRDVDLYGRGEGSPVKRDLKSHSAGNPLFRTMGVKGDGELRAKRVVAEWFAMMGFTEGDFDPKERPRT